LAGTPRPVQPAKKKLARSRQVMRSRRYAPPVICVFSTEVVQRDPRPARRISSAWDRKFLALRAIVPRNKSCKNSPYRHYCLSVSCVYTIVFAILCVFSSLFPLLSSFCALCVEVIRSFPPPRFTSPGRPPQAPPCCNRISSGTGTSAPLPHRPRTKTRPPARITRLAKRNRLRSNPPPNTRVPPHYQYALVLSFGLKRKFQLIRPPLLHKTGIRW